MKKSLLFSGLAVFGSLLLFACSSTDPSDDSKSSSGSDKKNNGSSSSNSGELSDETSLSLLMASVGTIPFHRDSLNYSLSFPYEVDRITLSASTMSAKSSLSGDVGVAKSLQVGDNTLLITVTAENGDQKNYTVQVRRRISVVLTNLTVSAGSLSPSFHTDSISYRADVSRELTIVATPQFSTASIVLERMNEESAVESYSNGDMLNFTDLPNGSITIRVRVTGEESETKAYTLVLWKQNWCAVAGNCGTFADSRDGTTYKWTKIGDQIWMAENLNFGSYVVGTANQKDATASSAEKFCLGNNESNCTTYGGLYQWHSAMALPYSCNSTSGCAVNTPHRGVCPEGWHVPTQAEWATFDAWVDADNGGTANNEGTSLKSVSGWSSRNGTDSYGWTGLPGGDHSDGRFFGQGDEGIWWSASEYSANDAWNRYLYYDYDNLREDNFYKNFGGFSVRCLKD